MIEEIRSNTLHFPDPNNANKDGIVAWGGDLYPYRIINAYQHGIFPWYSNADPILWWSPNPRLIMQLDDFKMSRSLKKSIKKFEYKIDENFLETILKCASAPRKEQEGTWINRDIIEAYTQLHKMGYAHSVESYQNDILVGGLYGIAIGKVFCGESMFADLTDASKAAYATLVTHLKAWGYSFIDCQVPTNHLKSLGAKEITREEFLYKLKKAASIKSEHEWKFDSSLSIQNK